MKIYTLLNPGIIESISTYKDGATSCMAIIYKTQNIEPKERSFLDNTMHFFKKIYEDSTKEKPLVKEHDIGYAVIRLLDKGLIDYNLALDIKFDHMHLFAGISLIDYKNTITIPYKCYDDKSKTTYQENNAIKSQYLHQQQLVIEQESIPESLDSLKLTQKEQKMIEESIANTPLQAAQFLVIDETNTNFVNAAEQQSKGKTPNYTCSHISKFGLGTEVHINNIHKIANFTCEFKQDTNLGLLLLISSDKTSEQRVQVSDKNRRDIFECHRLSHLIGVLKPLNNTESIIKTLERFNVNQIKPGFDI